jgi:hypothetical protein
VRSRVLSARRRGRVGSTGFTLEQIMKKLLMLIVLVGIVAPIIGCEAKVDDNGAKVKVDTNK